MTVPTRIVRVGNGQQAQAALDEFIPGDAIVMEDGDYGFLVWRRSGTSDAPGWLVARNRLGAKIIDPRTSGSGAAIAMWKLDNLIVGGLDITGYFRGIFAGADKNRTAHHIDIYANKIRSCKEDGIKYSHCDDGEIIGNDVADVGPDPTAQLGEGIDLVACRRVKIAHNNVRNVGSTASGINAKTGSREILIESNLVDGAPNANGISLGGASGSDVWRPDDLPAKIECRDSIARDNYAVNVGKLPLQFRGAHDCKGIANYLVAGTNSIGVGPSSVTASRNIELIDNTLAGPRQTVVVDPASVNVTQVGTKTSDAVASPSPWLLTDEYLDQLYAEKFPWLVEVTPPHDCTEERARIAELEQEVAAKTDQLQSVAVELANEKRKSAQAVAILTGP